MNHDAMLSIIMIHHVIYYMDSNLEEILSLCQNQQDSNLEEILSLCQNQQEVLTYG